MLQKLSALTKLGLHIGMFERYENHIIPFLPILKKLVIETAPFMVHAARPDELFMECRTNPGMLLESPLAINKADTV